MLKAGADLWLKLRPSRTSQEASDALDVDASPIDFEEGNRCCCVVQFAAQRYLITSIVMLVQYSGNRDDCSSGAAASDLLAARALGVTMRSIVARYASFAT